MFLRPHFGYGDIIYDQPSNESFCKKLESAQCQAELTITGATQGTSREKKVTELGLESLKSKRWFRRICCMYIPSYKCLTEYLKISFFPASLEEWLLLDPSIKKSGYQCIQAKSIVFHSSVRKQCFQHLRPR